MSDNPVHKLPIALRDQLLLDCVHAGDVAAACALLPIPKRETLFEIGSNVANGFAPDSLYALACRLSKDDDVLKAVREIVSGLNSSRPVSRHVA